VIKNQIIDTYLIDPPVCKTDDILTMLKDSLKAFIERESIESVKDNFKQILKSLDSK
jgi:hypothetical protein